LVDLEVWMGREDGGVGFSISREAIKIDGLLGIRDTFIQRFDNDKYFILPLEYQ